MLHTSKRACRMGLTIHFPYSLPLKMAVHIQTYAEICRNCLPGDVTCTPFISMVSSPDLIWSVYHFQCNGSLSVHDSESNPHWNKFWVWNQDWNIRGLSMFSWGSAVSWTFIALVLAKIHKEAVWLFPDNWKDIDKLFHTLHRWLIVSLTTYWPLSSCYQVWTVSLRSEVQLTTVAVLPLQLVWLWLHHFTAWLVMDINSLVPIPHLEHISLPL